LPSCPLSLVYSLPTRRSSDLVPVAVGVRARVEPSGVGADDADVVGGGHLGDLRIDSGPRVVEQTGTGAAGGVGDLMTPCVDADEHLRVGGGDGCDGRAHAVDLLGHGDLPATSGPHSPDIDDL